MLFSYFRNWLPFYKICSPYIASEKLNSSQLEDPNQFLIKYVTEDFYARGQIHNHRSNNSVSEICNLVGISWWKELVSIVQLIYA